MGKIICPHCNKTTKMRYTCTCTMHDILGNPYIEKKRIVFGQSKQHIEDIYNNHFVCDNCGESICTSRDELLKYYKED